MGDLPAEKIEMLFNSNYRMEYFKDAKCFAYDQTNERVKYWENYEDHMDPERLMPANEGKVDAELLASITTW